MKCIHLIGVVLCLALSCGVVKGDFAESFDSPNSQGQVFYRGDAIYLADGVMGGSSTGNSPYRNGFVIPSSGPTYFGNPNYGDIGFDQSGSGYFLFNGTENMLDPRPSYGGTVWRSAAAVEVVPNSTYEFSFFMTNANSMNPAILQAVIGSYVLPQTFSASGNYPAGNHWQRFSMLWTAPNGDPVDLSLVNTRTTGSGNDFGIDTISFVRQLTGDYNGNGVVDAADYTVWRDHLGQTFTLTNQNPAASTPGIVDQEDYNFWRSRFGATSGSGSGIADGGLSESGAVPEPSSVVMVCCAMLIALLARTQSYA